MTAFITILLIGALGCGLFVWVCCALTAVRKTPKR